MARDEGRRTDGGAMLHMFCGRIASGKSTLAAGIAAEGAVLIAEDAWLGALYADQMASGADYLRCSARLRGIMGPHVAGLLEAGVSVALDFPANTVETRGWMRGILAQTGAAHQMHVMTTDEAECLARLARRNAGGDHPFAVTEEQFRRFSRYYAPPTKDEGFELVLHDPGG